jgi:anion-transporting  ArsA/GET3 family ATPase
MASVLQHKLILVTGKGGVGKTTIASAVGLLAARTGMRTIVVELGDQHRLPRLLGDRGTPESGVEVELRQGLWSISVDPNRAMLEWLQTLGGRVSARVLGSSSTFQYFTAAAPGAKELVSMVKVWELVQGKRWHKHAASYDLVVVDAPATGHALAMLHSPSTFAAIARVGPIAGQAERVAELLRDPAGSCYLGVAQGTEMAVTETLELQQGLRRVLDRELHAVVVNGTLPQRFNRDELQRIAALNGGDSIKAAAGRAALAINDRARSQRNQIARLRRGQSNDETADSGNRPSSGQGSPAVLAVPFKFQTQLDLEAIEQIADQLEKKL